MAVTHTTAVRDGITNHIVEQLDVGGPGLLVFRLAGTAAAPGTAIASLSLGVPAFGASGAQGPAGAGTEPATAGRAYATGISSDTNATGNASPVATATLTLANGTTVIVHCAVAASGSDIDMGGSGLTIATGATVSCSSLSYTAPD